MHDKNIHVGELIRVCAGDHHAWYKSSAGPIRKPYKPPRRPWEKQEPTTLSELVKQEKEN